jgi:hypothetical protein
MKPSLLVCISTAQLLTSISLRHERGRSQKPGDLTDDRAADAGRPGSFREGVVAGGRPVIPSTPATWPGRHRARLELAEIDRRRGDAGVAQEGRDLLDGRSSLAAKFGRVAQHMG